MPLYHKRHVGHEKHLCKIIEDGATFDEYYPLVTNAKYLCRQCGRVATKAENLCDPTPLPSA